MCLQLNHVPILIPVLLRCEHFLSFFELYELKITDRRNFALQHFNRKNWLPTTAPVFSTSLTNSLMGSESKVLKVERIWEEFLLIGRMEWLRIISINIIWAASSWLFRGNEVIWMVYLWLSAAPNLGLMYVPSPINQLNFI